jgi:hypothetical protein
MNLNSSISVLRLILYTTKRNTEPKWVKWATPIRNFININTDRVPKAAHAWREHVIFLEMKNSGLDIKNPVGIISNKGNTR